MKPNPWEKEAEKIFESKKRRRQALAKLPIEKKILILIQLQKIAGGISSKKGEIRTLEWNLK